MKRKSYEKVYFIDIFLNRMADNDTIVVIIDEMAVNPKYYERMSDLLDALIEQRRQEALDYQAYLRKIVELTRRVSEPESQPSYPPAIDTGVLRALYDNLEELGVGAAGEELAAPFGGGDRSPSSTREALALHLDRAIRAVKKADWRGNRFKEREVRNAIQAVLRGREAPIDRIFEIVKAQREY